MEAVTPKWDSATKRTVALVVLALLALVIYRFRGVITPLILAFLLALILDPIVDWLEARLGMRRAGITAIVFVIVVLSVLAAPVVAMPPVMSAVRSLRLDFAQIMADLGQLLEEPLVIFGQNWDLQLAYQEVSDALETIVSLPTVAAGTFRVVVGFASTLFWLVFVVLSAFYLVKDADRIATWIDGLAPPSVNNDFVRLRERITQVWQAFLRGQLVMAVVLAAMTTVIDSVVGLPHALALGLLAGVMEFVPNVGPLIAAAPAVVVAFFEGSTWIAMPNLWFAVLIFGLYLVIQQIEGNVLLPKILGQSLNLHPRVILVAVILGGSLAGIIGVLLAAPTVATLKVLVDYIYCRLTDREPFPDPSGRPKLKRSLVLRAWDGVRKRALADRWVVRPARPEDGADVKVLCAKVWEGEDYIPGMWDEWVADTIGELTVVELKERVVALGKLSCLADGEWWLEGLRVEPAYRRLGVAQMLQACQVEVADRVGDGILRLGTVSSNKPVHINVARDGFHRVARFLVYDAESLPGPCPLRTLSPGDLDTAWELIEGSPVRDAANGLYEESAWHWAALTRAKLEAHLADGHVWGVDLENKLAGLAIVLPDRRPDRLLAAYVDGTSEGMTALLWGLRILTEQRGCDLLRVRPPDCHVLVQALETVGAKPAWDESIWIFERDLVGSLGEGEEDHGKIPA